jgi:hypothetical protein
MKDQRIVEMRIRAERDFFISDGACRLILRLCSMVYLDRNMLADDPFPLSATRVAELCGLPSHRRRKKAKTADLDNCYRRIYELLPQIGETYGRHRKSYLIRVQLRGCPPTWHFKLNL